MNLELAIIILWSVY